QIKTRSLQSWRSGQVLHLKQSLGALGEFARSHGEKSLDGPPHHVRDQFVIGNRSDPARSHALAIAQNSEVVGYLAHFFEKVADVNHIDVLIFEFANQAEEMLDIVALQTAGWLVHQNNSRVRGNRPANFHY